jgi:hypothetical protein
VVWASFFCVRLRHELRGLKCEGPESSRGLASALRFSRFRYTAKAAAELPHSKFAAAGVALVAVVPVAMVLTVFVTQMRLALVRLVAFVFPMTRVAAVGAEALDGFVVAPFGVGDAAIAVVPIVGFCGGRTGGQEETESRGGQSCLTEKRTEVKREKFHKIASRSLARAGDRGCIL